MMAGEPGPRTMTECAACGETYDDHYNSVPCSACGNWPEHEGDLDDSKLIPDDLWHGPDPFTARSTRKQSTTAAIPDDGYADGGAPYTDEEMGIIDETVHGVIDGASVSVGDKITNPGGINATDIPVGATVRYTTGVDQKDGEYEVMLSKGKKILGLSGTPMWSGHNGPMTVLSLPQMGPIAKLASEGMNRYRPNDEMGAGLQVAIDRVISGLQAAGHEARMDGRELVTSGSRSDVIAAAGEMGETFLSSRM